MATVKKELSHVNKCIDEVKEELDAKNKLELHNQKEIVQVKMESVKKEKEEEYTNHVTLATVANVAMICKPRESWLKLYREYVEHVRNSTATKSDFPHSDFLEIIKEWCKHKQKVFAGASTTCAVCRCAIHPSLVIGPKGGFVDAPCIGTSALCVFCATWTEDEKDAMSKIDSKLIEDKISEIQKHIGGSGAPSSSQGSKRYLPSPKGTHPKGFPLKCPPATRSPPRCSPPKEPPVKGPPPKHHPLAQAPAGKANVHDKLSIPARHPGVFGPELPPSADPADAWRQRGSQDHVKVKLESVEFKPPAVDKPKDTPAAAKSASRPAVDTPKDKPEKKPKAETPRPKQLTQQSPPPSPTQHNTQYHRQHTVPSPAPAPSPAPPEAQQATIPTVLQQCQPKAPQAEAGPWRRNQLTPPSPSQSQTPHPASPPTLSPTPHPVPPPKAFAPPLAPPPAPPQQSSLSSSPGKPL
jgi:ribosomal protein S27E